MSWETVPWHGQTPYLKKNYNQVYSILHSARYYHYNVHITCFIGNFSLSDFGLNVFWVKLWTVSKTFKCVVLFWDTENTFCSGDHISWHSPLDNSESRIQHMLLTEDPQMHPVQTPFGLVSFLQVRHNKYTLSSHCSCILMLFLSSCYCIIFPMVQYKNMMLQ